MLVKALLAILCVFAIPARTAAAWTSPTPVKMSLSLDLAPYFPGSLTIEELVLDYPNSIWAKGIVITDTTARPWLIIDSALMNLSDGTLKNALITIENPHLLIYVRNQDLDINLPPASPAAPAANWLTYLAQLKPALAVLRNFTFTLTSEPNHQTTIYGTNACLIPAGSQFALFASLDPNNATFQPAHHGNLFCTIDPCTAQINYNLDAFVPATPAQSSVILHAIDSDWIRAIQGPITLNCRASGCATDYVSLLPTGSGTITNAILYTANDEILCEKLAASITILPRRLLIEQIYATPFGGVASGEFFYSHPPDNTGIYGGFFRVRDISFSRFEQVFGGKSASSGRASFTVRFTRRSQQPQSLSAVAVVYLSHADLGNVPVIAHLFEFLKLKTADPLAFSDAVAFFNIAGSFIDFRIARLSSRLAAIEFEKGLKVDYQSKFVDGHAVIVPFAAVHRILTAIPLLGRFVTLSSQVSRVRIQGYWNQPAARLISKDIFKDLGQSTWDFLRGVSRTDGRIPDSAFESLEKLQK